MLNIPLPTLKLNLDPHEMEDLYSMFVVRQLYRGLFHIKPDGAVVSYLADNWNWTNEGKTLVVRLGRHTFSDGSPILASHVRASVARLFYKSSSMSADMSYIRGVENLICERIPDDFGVKVIDDYTVEFHLQRHTDLLFLHLACSDCAVLPLESDCERAKFIPAIGPFSGPYKVECVRETEIILAPVEGGARVRIFELRLDEAKNATDRNDIATLDVYPSDLFQSYDKKEWRKVGSALGFENFILLNPTIYSYEQRKSLRAAFDSKMIISKIGNYSLQPATGIVPTVLPGFLSETDSLEIPSQISELVKVELEFCEESRFMAKTANAVAALWSSAGHEVKLIPLSLVQYLDHLFGRKSGCILGAKGIDYPDGYSNLAYFISNVKNNFFFVTNSDLDLKIRELPFLEEDQRLAGYKEIQRQILRQCTYIPLFFGNNYSALWNRRVTKVPDHPLGFHFLDLEDIIYESNVLRFQ